MNFLKNYIISALFLIVTLDAWAQKWPLVERESESILAKKSTLQKIKKKWDKTNFTSELENINSLEQLWAGHKTASEIIHDIKSTPTFKKFITECLEDYSTEDALETCTNHYLEKIVFYMRSNSWIDDTASLIILAYVNHDKKQISWLLQKKIDLPTHLENTKSLKRATLRNNQPIQPTSLTSKIFKHKLTPWGQINARIELYLTYNSLEIKILGNILIKTQNRITADHASINWDFDGDNNVDDTFVIPPGANYDIALAVLDYTIQQETLSQGLLSNHQVLKPHLLAAASELGLINESVLNELIQLPELKYPNSNKLKIYLQALYTIGKTALMASPIGIYSILPVVVIESLIQSKKQQKARHVPKIF